MAGGKHFETSALASMSMYMIGYLGSLRKLLSACNTRKALEGLRGLPARKGFRHAYRF